MHTGFRRAEGISAEQENAKRGTVMSPSCQRTEESWPMTSRSMKKKSKSTRLHSCVTPDDNVAEGLS